MSNIIANLGYYFQILIALISAVVAAFWLASVIWAFRDMRLRSRDPVCPDFGCDYGVDSLRWPHAVPYFATT